MTVEHSTLTGTELHEPKGVAAISEANHVYLSDGAGSGAWAGLNPHIGGYISYDATTPAHQHSATTSDTALDPIFVLTESHDFTALASPNARLRYDGADDRHMSISFNASVRQAGGADRDIEFLFYLNGVALEGSRAVRTTSTGNWGSVSVNFDSTMSTNDYIEVFVKSSVAVTVDFAQAYLGIHGVPE